MLAAAILVIFPFSMAFAAISDILSMTIANRVSIILVAGFTILAPLAGLDMAAIGLHFAAGAVVLAFTFALFALGGMGGGDAKLLAASALWMGFGPSLLEYLLVSTVLGGFLTLAILVYRKSALSAFTGSNLFLRNFADQKQGVPYGVALGIGGMIVYPDSPLMQAAMRGFGG